LCDRLGHGYDLFRNRIKTGIKVVFFTISENTTFVFSKYNFAIHYMIARSLFRLIILATLFYFGLFQGISAQISQGGIPKSFSYSIAPDDRELVTIQPPVLDILKNEDIQSPVPYRFAVNLPVDLGIGNSGTWTKTPDGSSVWRLNLKATGALALTLYFDDFELPEGGTFFVYNPERTKLIGAFTSLNNEPQRSFATELIPGDRLTMEYNYPYPENSLPRLHVSEIAYAYRGVGDTNKITVNFGQAGKCEVNINCNEGAEWQQQKKGVARLSVKRGSYSYWCSGSLVNNVRNDHKPYFLTADHCGQGTTSIDLNKWIFYFDYETTGCPNPPNEPFPKSLIGAHLVANSGDGSDLGSDFFLVLLNKSIPINWDVFFNGWSREESPPAPGSGIHHPQGDIKKISTYLDPLQPSTWSGQPILTHWKTTWVATQNGHGVTEGGSSGSPIFDNGGHIVGTLTGGDSSCDSLLAPDYYGRFSYHWDKNGSDSLRALKYWLDPDNTNTLVLNGITLSVEELPVVPMMKATPNPFRDKVEVEIPGFYGNITVNVYDIFGNKAFNRDFYLNDKNKIQVDLENLFPGIYFLTINGDKSTRGTKLIKQP